MYDLEKFNSEKYYIHTETREKFNEVLDWLHEQGLQWRTGESLKTKRDNFDKNRENTVLCHFAGGVAYAHKDREFNSEELLPNNPNYRELLLQHLVESDFKFLIPSITIYKGYLVSYSEKQIIDLYLKYESLGYTREELVAEVERLKND